MTYLLSTSEREALLRALVDAPDDVLIDAVQQRKNWIKSIKSSFDEVRGFVGMKVTEAGKPPPASAGSVPVVKSAPQEVASRKDVSPGTPAIGKIGSTTKDTLLDLLKQGIQPNSKWSEHLKLLWLRHEIKFDGKEYYL